MTRQRFSILLMIITLAVIVTFQAIWLNKNYMEEKRLFLSHSNMLFRETVFKLQAAKLNLDTNIHIQDKAGIVSMTNVLQEEVRDSSRNHIRQQSSVVISINPRVGPHSIDSTDKYEMNSGHPLRRSRHIDSINRYYINLPAVDQKKGFHKGDSEEIFVHHSPNEKVFDFLAGVDSLQDSISVEEISKRFNIELAKQGPHPPFHIIAVKGGNTKEFNIPDPTDNKVTVGFTKPVTYEIRFDNLSWNILRRLGPQIFFSVLLISMTFFSFLLLYKNWIQQRKLTQLKNDFISNITHELKTPIATVSVAIEALKSFNALQDPQKTMEYLDISGNELTRLSLLVDKVLKLSMFEKDQIELKNEYFDMRSLIDEVLASMRLQFEKYHAQVSIQPEGNDFHVMADKLHITSVIFNLFDNALKYSKPNPSIQIRLKEEPKQIQLTITDNGIGIPAEYRTKIFDKFFRVPTGDKHNVKGYGLGLSYVAYVLQRQGGSISVESKVGIGSSFNIIIPKGNG